MSPCICLHLRQIPWDTTGRPVLAFLSVTMPHHAQITTISPFFCQSRYIGHCRQWPPLTNMKYEWAHQPLVIPGYREYSFLLEHTSSLDTPTRGRERSPNVTSLVSGPCIIHHTKLSGSLGYPPGPDYQDNYGDDQHYTHL